MKRLERNLDEETTVRVSKGRDRAGASRSSGPARAASGTSDSRRETCPSEPGEIRQGGWVLRAAPRKPRKGSTTQKQHNTLTEPAVQGFLDISNIDAKPPGRRKR